MNFINFIKDCIKQAIEDIKDCPNQIKGDTVLSWGNRIFIAAAFFSLSLLIAYLLFYSQLKENAVLITAAFTFINGIGIFIIRTTDRKKEFNDRKQDFKDALFSQRNSRLLDAIKLISQESEKYKEDENSGGLNQAVIRFAFSELIALSQFPDFKRRIDLFTSYNSFIIFDLSGLDLSRFDFNETRLHGAHLRDTKLIKAKLNYANFASTDLVGADFSDADLSRARLGSADLSNAKLAGAILSNTDFSRSKLYKTDLRDADLAGAIWNGANLEDAIRCDADLEKFKQ